MARVSVEVPAELVGPVRETVLLLYEATAESLHLALRAHSEGRGSPRGGARAPRAARAARRACSTQLGRPSRRRGSVERRRAELLHDAFYGALIDAGERLAVTASNARGAASSRWSACRRRRPRCSRSTGSCACWSRSRSD